jgi:protein-tyrosine kinase
MSAAMNPSPGPGPGPAAALHDPLQQALVDKCGLSETDVADIGRAQTQDALDFSTAAVKLKLVSMDDLERARSAAVQERPRPQPAPQRRLLRRDPTPSPMARPGLGSEQMQVLRTELLLRHDRQTAGANVVAVISPGAVEGRSQIAADLARSFSRTGQSTLLIDADLRRPSQHQRFAQANNPGLVEAITDSRSPQFCSLDNAGLLFLLPAGGPTDSAAELLSSRSFETLLDRWAQQFDHIVIDTPPANDYPDVQALGTIARRVLLVSRAQRTSLNASREMMRRLQAMRVEILGAVVCHF